MKGVAGAARMTSTKFKVDAKESISLRDYARPRTQAHRIFLKFGGVVGLCKALELIQRPRQLQAMYRWLYSRDRGGSDGLIPTQAMPDVLLAARYMGIVLSSEDLDPRAIPIDTTVKKIKVNQKHDL